MNTHRHICPLPLEAPPTSHPMPPLAAPTEHRVELPESHGHSHQPSALHVEMQCLRALSLPPALSFPRSVPRSALHACISTAAQQRTGFRPMRRSVGHEARGILAPWPGIKPAPPALEGKGLSIEPSREVPLRPLFILTF